MDDFRRQVRSDLEHQFRRGYGLGTLLLACYFAGLVPYYLVAYVHPLNQVIALVAAGAVIGLIVVLAALQYDRIPPRYYQILGAAGMAIILTPIVVQLALVQDVRFQAEIGLVLVANALVLHDRIYFIPGQLVTLGLWIGVLEVFSVPGNRLHMGLGILSALIVSVTTHLILRGLMQNQEALRIQDLEREQEKVRLLAELAAAFESVRTLRGLVPICSQCKKVRDDHGFWQRVETFVEDRSHAQFTHGLCPACHQDLQDEFEEMLPPDDGAEASQG